MRQIPADAAKSGRLTLCAGPCPCAPLLAGKKFADFAHSDNLFEVPAPSRAQPVKKSLEKEGRAEFLEPQRSSKKTSPSEMCPENGASYGEKAGNFAKSEVLRQAALLEIAVLLLLTAWPRSWWGARLVEKHF